MKLRIGLYVVASILLAAHFLRGSHLLMVALCLAVPLLFLWKTRWSLVALQLLAYGAAVTWIVVAIQLVQVRWHYGERWVVAAVILGSVALYTLLAGLLLNSRTIRDHYSKWPKVRSSL
jgi:hypothetical protein